MKKKWLIIGFALVLVVVGFAFLENKITGNATGWRVSDCDSNYLDSLWGEVFFVDVNSSGYFNEITNADSSTTCEIHSYNYIGTKLYVLVATSKNSGVKEELNYTAYYSSLNGAGENTWKTVNISNSGQIDLFFNEGADNFWALRITQPTDASSAATEYSNIFRERQNATGWSWNSADSGFDMHYNNYTIPSSGEQNVNLWAYVMKEREQAILNYRDTRVENGSWFRPITYTSFSIPTIYQGNNTTVDVGYLVKGFTNFSVKTVWTNQSGNITIVLNQSGKKVDLKPTSTYVGTIFLNLTASNYVSNVSIPFSLIVGNVSGSGAGDNNTIPTLVKEFSDISMIKNTNYTLNLTGYFTDRDGDNLSYSTRRGANITTFITNTSLKVVPSKDFVGESWMMVVAEDDFDIRSSNKINILVFENATQLALNQTNTTQNQTVNFTNTTNTTVLKTTQEISNLPSGNQVTEKKTEPVDPALLISVFGGLFIIFLGLVGILIFKRKEFFGKKEESNPALSPNSPPTPPTSPPTYTSV